jgi:histidine triad (HIT) family protein
MTLFEKIIAREIPATIEFEDDEIIAFRDILPVAPVHILLVTKKPIASPLELAEADSALVGKLVIAGQALAKKYGIADSGFRLVMNNGREAGQSVDHLHMHLIGGRELSWPPG